MTKKTHRSKKKHFDNNGYYGHPEENIYGRSRSTGIMDDELRRSSLKSMITGLTNLIKEIKGRWKDKPMTQEASSEIMRLSARLHDAKEKQKEWDSKE